MNNILKNFRHLIALALVLSVAILGCAAQILSPGTAFLIVGLWQLSQFAISPRRAGVFYSGLMTPEQWEETEKVTLEAKSAMTKVLAMADRLKAVELQLEKSTKGLRWIGGKPFVSDACAKAITSVFVLSSAKQIGALNNLVPDDTKRKHIIATAAGHLGIEVKTAMTSTDIPLPVLYAPEVIELTIAYGAARKYATVFPLGGGQVKLPRLKAGEDEFGFMGVGTDGGMSQPVPEKKVQTELVTFDTNKAGGIIRIPYELDEDTFIPLGQFFARYIARQLAKLEDRSLFLADGTSDYAEIVGIASYCTTNTDYLLQLATGKTAPADVTLADLQNLRSKVSAAVLSNMSVDGRTSAAYYLHPTFEPLLRSFNKYPNYIVFEYVNGQPMFEGYPVHWIGVSQPNTTSAAAAKPVAFFGDLSYWYLGEKGQIRIEISKEVYFATDELAMRALERIDIQNMAVDAMATLKTAAS